MNTPIADMVQEMLARGVAADVIVLAVRTAEGRSSPELPVDFPVDTAAENRRAYDRARKAAKRQSGGKSGGVPPESPVDAARPITTLPLGSTDSEKKEQKASRPPTNRGTRIPPDWQPPQTGVDFGFDHGLVGADLRTEIVKFKNHWSSKTGRDATKLDWSKTWENWVLNSVKFNGNGKSYKPGGKPNLSELAFELADEARERESALGFVRPNDPFRGD